MQSLLVPKRDTTDPLAHKRLEFDTFLELGSVHALQVETVDLKWHEVVHRVLTGRISGRNLSLDRCRQSRRHVDDRSSLCFVGLRVAAYALRAVGLRFVRGQGDEFVVGSRCDGFSSLGSVGVSTSARKAKTRQTNSVTELAVCGLIDSGPVELHIFTRSREQEEEVCKIDTQRCKFCECGWYLQAEIPLTARRTVERRQEADPMRQKTARRA